MKRYDDPRALEASIVQRLRNRFGTDELGRRRSEVAYRRLIARLAIAAPGRWVVKGGYGLILRLDPNRMSNDIDVVFISAAGEHAAALAALEAACAADLADHFAFAITRVDEPDPTRACSVTIAARLGTRLWATFQVDLAVPRIDVPSTALDAAPSLTGIPQVDELPVGLRVLAWPEQIAEKVCAMFERRLGGSSGRVRDLLDLAMIAEQIDGLNADEIIAALDRDLARRPLLPDGLPPTAELDAEQRELWRAASHRATRGAPISVPDAERIVRGFLDPVLDGSAAGRRWDAEAQAWRGPAAAR